MITEKGSARLLGPCACLEVIAILSCAYDQVPENGTDAPLAVLKWPIAIEPTV
jgi:hypothetical protein